MGSDRCPSCAAAVRKDAAWCTLCYTDLRPAPAPVARAPYPRPSTPPAQLLATLGLDAGRPGTDALHAPYEHVLAAVYGGAVRPPAGLIEGAPDGSEAQPPTRPVGWPCSQCGELNDFERLTCGVCTAPFGAALRTAGPAFDRKQMMIYALGGALAFLLLVAALTFVSTKRPPAETGTTGGATSESVVPPPPDNLEPAPVVPAPVVPAPAGPGQTVPGQTAVPGQSGVPVPGQPVATVAPVLPQQLDPNAQVPAQ